MTKTSNQMNTANPAKDHSATQPVEIQAGAPLVKRDALLAYVAHIETRYSPKTGAEGQIAILAKGKLVRTLPVVGKFAQSQYEAAYCGVIDLVDYLAEEPKRAAVPWTVQIGNDTVRKQLSGEFRVKEPALKELHAYIRTRMENAKLQLSFVGVSA